MIRGSNLCGTFTFCFVVQKVNIFGPIWIFSALSHFIVMPKPKARYECLRFGVVGWLLSLIDCTFCLYVDNDVIMVLVLSGHGLSLVIIILVLRATRNAKSPLAQLKVNQLRSPRTSTASAVHQSVINAPPGYFATTSCRKSRTRCPRSWAVHLAGRGRGPSLYVHWTATRSAPSKNKVCNNVRFSCGGVGGEVIKRFSNGVTCCWMHLLFATFDLITFLVIVALLFGLQTEGASVWISRMATSFIISLSFTSPMETEPMC